LKKVVIISSGQPSLNPRMVKEADALAEAGYNVTVLYAYWNNWGTKFDKELLPSKKWKAICAGGDPQQTKITYFLSRVIHKAAKIISRRTQGKYWAELAIARGGYFLIREAKKHQADIYIGHNLGALPATVKAAKANKKPCGFDAEDFHRFEVSDDKANTDVVLKTELENRYLPQVDYLTASSPLIAKAYQKLYPGIKPVVIVNVFPCDNNIKQAVLNQDGPIKLFWFSQTIGPNRGIEDVINALILLKDQPFELHLLGYLSAEFQNSFIDKIIGKSTFPIYFHEPIPSDEITAFASQFDIGLASENNIPLNRDICLTNKIFTYIQAGMAIVASDTTAQVDLLNEYPGIGKIYQKGNAQSLAVTLSYYHQNRKQLFEARKASLLLARQKLNWETESGSFLSTVEKTLSSY
jgi:glycosyltransferase involved in cell wall biosynthesis